MHSFTEENYLKTIYYLASRQTGEVSTNALAEMTATKAASVSDMLRKLADKQLIHYKKYQGVRLTEEGERVALQIIRRHRLWEVFLVEKLGFGWDAVHDIAEELEHIRSEELVTRLDTYLGCPQFDPHGDPIPTSAGQMPQTGYQKLSEINTGQRVQLMGVLEHSTEFLQHLDHLDLTLSCSVTVAESNAFDKSLLVQLESGRTVFVSHEVAKNLLVGESQ
ncbi:metal-dependent transcriptional regulator [Spirosoma sp. BT702]|uniref:Transcriptional regulator MntR n=1 Tax=Spirosoma profusum TaxID=2771354 RepID=A0A926Y022_9BACT|nr:metal-dependent transcriptional regulator [Spirosoma profusum]MBD2699306.1 metal-dependent transcriptional regulator [Spirosoma profusum]